MMSKTYLLDTNIISYLTDSQSPHRESVKNHLFSLSEEDRVAVSIVTLYELAYGLATFEKTKKDKRDRDKKLFESGIEFIKEYLEIFPLRVEEIDIFGRLKATYKKETGINTSALKKNDLDFLIASTAMSQGAILVSNDGIFGDIVAYGFGLTFEEWV